MLISQFRCPSCGVLLKPGQPQPPGKDIKCSQCGTRFFVPTQNADQPIKAAPVPTQVTPPPATQVRLARDLDPEAQQEFFGRPRRRRFRSKEASGGNGLLIALSIIFGILLVAVVTLAVIGSYLGWFERLGQSP